MIEVHRRVRGEKHASIAYLKNSRAQRYQQQGRYQEAETLLLDVYEQTKDTPAPDNRLKHLTLNYLVKLYEAWGKPQKAAEFRALLPAG